MFFTKLTFQLMVLLEERHWAVEYNKESREHECAQEIY